GQIRGETQMNLTQALGWTLIHFLWQGAIVAIALACVLLLLRRKAPTTRYAAGCAAMMLMLLFAGATFIDFAFSTKGSVAAPVRFVQVFLESGFSAGAATVVPARTISDYLTIFVWAWLGGVIALSVRSFGGWAVASRFARKHTRPAEAFWEERFLV